MTAALNPLLDDLRDESISAVSLSLPTSGFFYPEDSVDVLAEGTDPTEIEVRPLGIMAELVSKDPFLLASGQGIPRIIRQVCPSVLAPGEMCDIDIEAILIASRIASYGPEYDMIHVCSNPETKTEKDEDGKDKVVPVCRVENNIEVDLTKHIMLYEPMDIDAKSADHSGWLLTFPEIRGQKVHLRPAVYSSAIALARQSVALNRVYNTIADRPVDDLYENEEVIDTYSKILDGTLDAQVKSILGSILYVENTKGMRTYDTAHIAEWLKLVPSTVINTINRKVEAFSKDHQEKTAIRYTCPDCGFENTIDLELDPQKLFFYDQQASEAPKTQSATSKKTAKPRKIR